MKPERQAAEGAKELSKQALLKQYDHLKDYATSIDPSAAAVKIRLKDAREAAEEVDDLKFKTLGRDIMTTLEEQYTRISTARKCLPGFADASPLGMTNDSSSSQPSVEWLDAPCSPQLFT